jgi:hypothetical protein
MLQVIMAKNIPSISNLHIVPEEVVVACAQYLEGEENNFELFLELAKEFRDAGLTPVFLCSYSMKDLYVTTQESLQKKLN